MIMIPKLRDFVEDMFDPIVLDEEDNDTSKDSK